MPSPFNLPMLLLMLDLARWPRITAGIPRTPQKHSIPTIPKIMLASALPAVAGSTRYGCAMPGWLQVEAWGCWIACGWGAFFTSAPHCVHTGEASGMDAPHLKQNIGSHPSPQSLLQLVHPHCNSNVDRLRCAVL